VNEARPERPLLATIICLLEAAIAVLAISAHFLRIYLRNLHSHTHYSLAPLNYTPLHYAATGLACALALAIAITLWQMRRAAFYLLATRTALSLASLLAGLLRAEPMPTNSRIISLAALALTAAITWYVYVITKRKPEMIPLPEDAIPSQTPSEPSKENQSMTQFYLSDAVDPANRKSPD
jgi:hypothetical protein